MCAKTSKCLPGRSHAEQNSVVVGLQVDGRDVAADGHAGHEVDPLGRQKVDSPLDDFFGKFHRWNAVLKKVE